MTKAHKEAIIIHMKYIIRDTLFYSELLDIRKYLDEIIEEKEQNDYTKEKQKNNI